MPLVDAGMLVEGHPWATKRNDGRHYHPIVPLEVILLLGVLTDSPPSLVYNEWSPVEPTAAVTSAPALSVNCRGRD